MAGDSADDGRSSCGGLGSDIWYSYFPSFTGNLTISICNGSDYDPVLAVYERCVDCVSFNLLGCDARLVSGARRRGDRSCPGRQLLRDPECLPCPRVDPVGCDAFSCTGPGTGGQVLVDLSSGNSYKIRIGGVAPPAGMGGGGSQGGGTITIARACPVAGNPSASSVWNFLTKPIDLSVGHPLPRNARAEGRSK